jgi:thiol-disulfide isomerase/thioredoxin
MTFATLLFALIALPTGTERSGEPIMLDFTATWCGPCRSMKPAVEKLVEKGYPIKAVDIDRSPDLAERYQVSGVPTFIVIDPSDGHELARTSGALPALELANLYRDAKAKFLAARAPADDDSPAVADDPSDEKRPEPKPTKPNPDPWETVVRIKVHGHGSIGFGSGTVISSTPQESLILTCAHIFHMDGRQQTPPSKFPLRITIDLFDGNLVGRQPSQVHYANETFEGEAVDYDFDRDVGLIRIRPGHSLPFAKVVPPHWSPKSGFGMITVGCSEGHDASAWRTTIVNPAMKGLQGKVAYEAIECLIAPKEGRSGGGLFTTDGYVAGVCDFAEPRGGHGLYATPRSIYKILDRNRLATLYDPTKSPDRLLADRGATGARSIPVKQRLQSPESETSPVTLPEPELLGIKTPKVGTATLTENAADRRTAAANRQSWHPKNAIPTGQKLAPTLDPDRFDQGRPAAQPAEPEIGTPSAESSNEAEPAPAPRPASDRATPGKWRAGRTPLPGFAAASAN